MVGLTVTDMRFGKRTRRVVIVADNSLIIEAIRIGLRTSAEFNLVGHADPRRTSVTTIMDARPDVILLDDMDRSQRTVDITREFASEDPRLTIIVLSVEMETAWLEHVFSAGATGVISKATHPVALATLLREMLHGHIFHRVAGMEPSAMFHSDGVSADELPLTKREVEILQLVAAGLTNSEVARKLWVTEQTVKFHLRNIYRKLDVANRTEASHFAHVNGLVRAESNGSAKAEPVLTAAK
jgi:DNA-binding NarL/FixJ family response regulator